MQHRCALLIRIALTAALATVAVDATARKGGKHSVVRQTDNFEITYSAGGGGAATEAFIDAVAEAAEATWAAYDALGWPDAPHAGERYPIMVKNLGQWVGWVDSTRHGCDTTADGTTVCDTAMTLDNDMSYYSEEARGDIVRTTVAHEYLHSVQAGLNWYANNWLLEASATWAEEQVFPPDSGTLPVHVRYVYDSYVPTVSIEDQDPYASWMFLQHLTERYGMDIIRDAWVDFTPDDSGAAALEALDNGLGRVGATLEQAYASYALAFGALHVADAGGALGFQHAAAYDDFVDRLAAGRVHTGTSDPSYDAGDFNAWVRDFHAPLVVGDLVDGTLAPRSAHYLELTAGGSVAVTLSASGEEISATVIVTETVDGRESLRAVEPLTAGVALELDPGTNALVVVVNDGGSESDAGYTIASEGR